MSLAAPYAGLDPDTVLNALDSVGLRGDGAVLDPGLALLVCDGRRPPWGVLVDEALRIASHEWGRGAARSQGRGGRGPRGGGV